jgi:hypothetical protein
VVFDRLRTLGVAALTVGALSFASAQTGADPFFDQTMVQSHAYGVEMVLLRLSLVDAYEPPVHEDLMEQIEKALGRDVPRFLGTLQQRDPELATDLVEALEAVEEAAEDGEDATELAAAARELTLRAYEVLVDDATRASLSFQGAVLADLLLADDGVAEAYEDAAEEELWEYANGWGALQRVRTLWHQLAPHADARQIADVEEMLTFLAENVYPTREPPEAITGNPEEAEASAHRMVGLLETIVDASLYSGRDLPLLAGHLADLMAPSCDAFEAGNDTLGVEGAHAARNHYRKHLRRLLDLVAPELHERIADHLDALTGREDAPYPDDPAAACRDLVEGLVEARAALGG